jgi:hypothetical protein
MRIAIAFPATLQMVEFPFHATHVLQENGNLSMVQLNALIVPAENIAPQ